MLLFHMFSSFKFFIILSSQRCSPLCTSGRAAVCRRYRAHWKAFAQEDFKMHCINGRNDIDSNLSDESYKFTSLRKDKTME